MRNRDLWLQVKRVIREADVVLEVVDARDPLGTRSREVEALVKKEGKPLVIVINKADIVPKEVLEEWKRVLRREFPTIFVSARERLGTRKLWLAIKKAAGKRPVKVAVVGYPNVGKSTIINVLRGRHSAGTSPVPGYTKHAQLVRAATWLRVIDTPGVVPTEGSEEELVIKCALSPESLEDPIPAALGLIETALERDPEIFARTYGVESREPAKILEELAERRKLYLKGGRLNVEEAARILIRDWQKAKLVFYYTPRDYESLRRGEG